MTDQTPKTAHQQLLEKLNDYDFAAEYRLKKQAEIEEMIAQILMVCTGTAEAPEGEWSIENLFKIFEVFMINHDKFSRSLLAEDLQHYLFTWTKKHGECFGKWSDSITAEETAAPTAAGNNILDLSQMSAASLHTSDSEIDNLALTISGLLNNPNLPGTIHTALSEAVTQIYNAEIDQSEILKHEHSGERIAMILRGLPKQTEAE